jgi:hypothetical protein
MERSDTQPEPVIPKREEVEGDSPQDRMMRMVLSLRAELYDLYAKHQALLDENNRLRATNVVQIKLKESKDALPPAAAREDEPVLGSVVADRAETLDLPTTEDASRTADAGVVSGDENERPLTPMPNTPKFPLQPVEFRPVSPSEHGLQEPPPLAPALVGSSSICCMSPPPNVESENP